MIFDYHLKAVDLDQLHSSMLSSGLARCIVELPDPEFDGDGSDAPMVKHLVLKQGVALDVIGEIQRLDSNGEIENIPGCHSNLRVLGFKPTPDQLALLPIIATPNRPVRVWA